MKMEITWDEQTEKPGLLLTRTKVDPTHCLTAMLHKAGYPKDGIVVDARHAIFDATNMFAQMLLLECFGDAVTSGQDASGGDPEGS